MVKLFLHGDIGFLNCYIHKRIVEKWLDIITLQLNLWRWIVTDINASYNKPPEFWRDTGISSKKLQNAANDKIRNEKGRVASQLIGLSIFVQNFTFLLILTATELI